MAYIHQMASVEQGNLDEPQQLLERETQTALAPQERQPQVRDQCDPHVGHDRMFGGSQKGIDRQVLCARLEEQLDLPPCFIAGRNRGGGQLKGLGPAHLVVAGLRVTGPHPPEGVRGGRAVFSRAGRRSGPRSRLGASSPPSAPSPDTWHGLAGG